MKHDWNAHMVDQAGEFVQPYAHRRVNKLIGWKITLQNSNTAVKSVFLPLNGKTKKIIRKTGLIAAICTEFDYDEEEFDSTIIHTDTEYYLDDGNNTQELFDLDQLALVPIDSSELLENYNASEKTAEDLKKIQDNAIVQNAEEVQHLQTQMEQFKLKMEAEYKEKIAALESENKLMKIQSGAAVFQSVSDKLGLTARLNLPTNLLYNTLFSEGKIQEIVKEKIYRTPADIAEVQNSQELLIPKILKENEGILLVQNLYANCGELDERNIVAWCVEFINSIPPKIFEQDNEDENTPNSVTVIKDVAKIFQHLANGIDKFSQLKSYENWEMQYSEKTKDKKRKQLQDANEGKFGKASKRRYQQKKASKYIVDEADY